MALNKEKKNKMFMRHIIEIPDINYHFYLEHFVCALMIVFLMSQLFYIKFKCLLKCKDNVIAQDKYLFQCR